MLALIDDATVRPAELPLRQSEILCPPRRARRLTDEEGRRMQQIVRRGKHGSVRVRRAMIIMASASGTQVPAIARLVAADEDTVRDVIHLFNAKEPVAGAQHRSVQRLQFFLSESRVGCWAGQCPET